MYKHMRAGIVLAGLGLVVGGGAQAEDAGWYFALSGGLTTTNISNADLDDTFVAVNEAILSAAAEELGTTVTVDAGFVDSTQDDTDKGWGVHVGYRFNRFVAAEAGYIDLGRFNYENQVQLQATFSGFGSGVFIFDSDARFQSRGPFASMLGMYPITERFDVHVRGGIFFADTRVRLRTALADVPDSVASIEFKDDSQELFAAIGASWNINEGYSLRVEYQRFLDVGDDETGEEDVSFVNAAILFR